MLLSDIMVIASLYFSLATCAYSRQTKFFYINLCYRVSLPITRTRMDVTSFKTLMYMNVDRFKEKGDSLVVFTHWFLLKYNFDLMQNDKVTMYNFLRFYKFSQFSTR